MPLLTRRIAIIGGLTAMTAAATGLVASQTYAKGIEIPSYEVIADHDLFEVRRYAPRLVAEVEVEGKPRDASNAGFRVLADFIFGNNTAQGSIAMTAPVDRRASEAIAMTAPVDRRAAAPSGPDDERQRWVITFTMPSKYTKDTLPQPVNERVRIREIPARHYAVMRFSGNPGEKKIEQRMDFLAKRVLEQGYRTAGKPPTYARYDPPWTLPILRRNEILLQLDVEPEPGEAKPN